MLSLICISIYIYTYDIYICIHTYTYVGSVAYVWFFRGWRVCASERGHSGSRLIGSWLPLNAPPFVPIPLVGISATSCPHLWPKSLGHRCGHVVADKPAEDSVVEGKASSKLAVTTPACVDLWKPMSTIFGSICCLYQHIW